MRILIDYRPALRERTGVGEYVHQVALALAERPTAGDRSVALFSSSWKDRLPVDALDVRFRCIDRRIPVSLLNFLWHRVEWPPIEWLAGRPFDVVHSAHPLLTPARTAAQVVTVHDLDFLDHPERTRAEIRRDYPRLARAHAARADAIVVVSRHVAAEVASRFQVDPAKIHVCPAGAPDWPARPRWPESGHILFMGTLEARKNIEGLLAAYRRLMATGREIPELVLAGKASPEASTWLEEISRTPLRGRVRALGYVPPDRRPELYERASVLVLPSFHEGFGLPALEAMSMGVPVVASNRGALPELVGDAGILVDPEDVEAIAAGIDRMFADAAFRQRAIEQGWTRARSFSWRATAEAVRAAYDAAVERRRYRPGTAA